MVLRYSTRLRRRGATRPGSGSSGSMPKASYLIQRERASISAGVGRAAPSSSGGIRPARTFFRTANHTSWRRTTSASDPSSSRETPPLRMPPPWQSRQYLASNGSIVVRKLRAASAAAGAAETGHPNTPRMTAGRRRAKRRGMTTGTDDERAGMKVTVDVDPPQGNRPSGLKATPRNGVKPSAVSRPSRGSGCRNRAGSRPRTHQGPHAFGAVKTGAAAPWPDGQA